MAHPRPKVFYLLAAGSLLLVVCGLLLGACALPVRPGPATPAATAEATATPPHPDVAPTATLTPGLTVLTFWEPYPLDRPEGDLIAGLVRDFEAETPGVRVRIVPRSGVLGVQDAFLVATAEGGELPDVAIAFPSTIAEIAATGRVVPLDAYLADPELGLAAGDLADLCAGCLDAGRLPGYGGRLLAFPFVHNAVGMWVNDSLLEAAGWDHPPATWAEFEQACFDVWGRTGVRCLPFVESVSVFNAWLYSRGGRQLGADGASAEFQGPAGVESLALLRRLVDAGLAWRPDDAYGEYGAFARGEAAFAFASTANRRLLAGAYDQAIAGGMAPFRWHQALLPQADPAQPATAAYGTSFFIVRGDPARQAAAWRLIRWFATPRPAARLAEGLDVVPIRAGALAVMTGTVAAYPFLPGQVSDILPYALPEPAVPQELAVREILYTALVSVTQGAADPGTVLDWAAVEVNTLLGRGP